MTRPLLYNVRMNKPSYTCDSCDRRVSHRDLTESTGYTVCKKCEKKA